MYRAKQARVEEDDDELHKWLAHDEFPRERRLIPWQMDRTRRESTSQTSVLPPHHIPPTATSSHLPATDRDYVMPSVSAGVAPEKASAILSQFERKRKAAALAVPTDDGRVRAKLREMGEPMTLFGEDAADRRGRLRHLMLESVEDEMADGGEEMADAQDDEAGEEEFYTEGIPDLLEARKWIARYSIPRAKERVAAQKAESGIALRIHSKHRKAIKDRLQMFELAGSQIAGNRPVAIARFAPNGESLAAGNWGGGIEVLDVPNLERKRSLNAHTGRVGGLAWMPGATLPGSSVSEDSANLASGAEDGTVRLWSLTQDDPISTLTGHSGRVCRVEFHPSGRYIASASYDTSWRLWDVETGTELLIQEGHSRELYTVSFNIDGSLLASAGLDSIGRIWDLRTGRTLMILDGHIREIYALDWGVDGYRVLSGSGDGFVKCWDLRMVREAGRIGAHGNVVSDLRWFKGLDGSGAEATARKKDGGDGETKPRKSGSFFVSSGYDKRVNIFSADDWALVKSLSGHAGNVTSVDVTADSRWIASSGQDRTVKLWGCDDGLGI
ncbi:MAG: hypothetical protein LQ340_001601 [Diploschistes diacapsis]|nr:MAG: hypothetical protein LQ340_001601 [Diploschistes diacapsis]